MKICFQHPPNRACCSTATSPKRKMHATTKCLHSFVIMEDNYIVHELTPNLGNKERSDKNKISASFKLN
jgi:hypothetical protein